MSPPTARAARRARADRRPGRLGRAARPLLERLEDRLVLYATEGAAWANPAIVTYSFVPDGTSIGGVASNLFSAMNALFPTATWEHAIQDAAAVWGAVADINFVQVGDNGAAIGSAGDQQGDPHFGDIRIGGYSEGAGVLASADLPPPVNGGTDAGDVFFNTNPAQVSWQTNGSNYDLETVALHEFGHALGLSHNPTLTQAVMYAYYEGAHNGLNADDASGAESIYAARPLDSYEAADNNTSYANAVDISGNVNGNKQASLPNLQVPTNSYVEFFKVVVPAGNNGSIAVTAQSLWLGSLDPKVQVMDSTYHPKATAGTAGLYGAQTTATYSGVSTGQTYYIRVSAVSPTPSAGGTYGLQVNFGNGTMPLFPSPTEVIPSAPDQGGGGTDAQVAGGGGGGGGPKKIAVGGLSVYGDYYMIAPAAAAPAPPPPAAVAQAPAADPPPPAWRFAFAFGPPRGPARLAFGPPRLRPPQADGGPASGRPGLGSDFGRSFS